MSLILYNVLHTYMLLLLDFYSTFDKGSVYLLLQKEEEEEEEEE